MAKNEDIGHSVLIVSASEQFDALVKNALQESFTGPHALSKSQAWNSKATKMARQVGEAAILTYLRKLKTFLS